MISRRSKLLISGAGLMPLSWAILAVQLPRMLHEQQAYAPPPYLLRLAPVIWTMFIVGGLFIFAALVSLALENRRPR